MRQQQAEARRKQEGRKRLQRQRVKRAAEQQAALSQSISRRFINQYHPPGKPGHATNLPKQMLDEGQVTITGARMVPNKGNTAIPRGKVCGPMWGMAGGYDTSKYKNESRAISSPATNKPDKRGHFSRQNMTVW
jgi:hypothetical protein